MYRGMGFGPTSGRGSVLMLDRSYDLDGRAIANPPLRDGGIPVRRDTGGQLFDVLPVAQTLPLQVTEPLVSQVSAVINSSGIVPAGEIGFATPLFGLADVPWWGWAGLGVGAWYLFGKGGRR